MTGGLDLIAVLRAVGSGERVVAEQLLDAAPQLVLARVRRDEEFFLDECHAQVYAGDSALHAAAFAYDTVFARRLVESGADVRARNRRGGEPLHAAAIGGPGSSNWDPGRQRAVIAYLIEVDADPNAVAVGGVTPLHRAVRNRCSSAVEASVAIWGRPSPRKRQRFNRVRARSLDDRARGKRFDRSKS